MARRGYFYLARLVALALAISAFCALPAFGQQQCDDAAVTGYTVRSVVFRARAGRVPPALKTALAARRGESYSSLQGTAYAEQIKQYLAENPDQVADEIFGAAKLQAIQIKVSLYQWCATPLPESVCQREFKNPKNPDGGPVTKCVDVAVTTKAVKLDIGSVATNLLPLPRSNRVDFFKLIPAPLLALNPSFGLERDRTAGVAPTFSFSTNLLDLGRSPASDKSVAQTTQLRAAGSGAKPVDQPFYRSHLALSFSRLRPAKLLAEYSAEATFDANSDPHSVGRLLDNSYRAAGALKLKPNGSLVSQISLGAGYAHTSNRLFMTAPAGSLLAEMTPENRFEARVITDGQIAGGFTRLGIWGDVAKPARFQDSYKRLAARAGYEKEIPVALNQTIGIEAQAGAGRAWGPVPDYSRFYAGSIPGQFLYDQIDSTTMTGFPTGPLLRSVGQSQSGLMTPAGIRGATSYWHANLNVTVPIPGLSRALIPNETVAEFQDGNGVTHRKTLKDVMKNQVASGKTMFILATARQKLTSQQQDDLALAAKTALTPDESARLAAARAAYEVEKKKLQPEADRLWGQITPITGFIADQANLYSIKPLLLLDAASVAAPGPASPSLISSTAPGVRTTRYAAGAGLQFTIVVARFEAGYLRTLNRLPTDNRGNFYLRLVFQNLY